MDKNVRYIYYIYKRRFGLIPVHVDLLLKRMIIKKDIEMKGLNGSSTPSISG